ncbi:hypothetical protein JMJ77_0006353, partial [Colletotrichum scovillei]
MGAGRPSRRGLESNEKIRTLAMLNLSLFSQPRLFDILLALTGHSSSGSQHGVSSRSRSAGSLAQS